MHDLRHFAVMQTSRVANLVETMSRLGPYNGQGQPALQQQVSGCDVEIAEALSPLAEGGVIPDPDPEVIHVVALNNRLSTA